MIALVSGASRGIGEAVARKFAKNGYKVIVNYISSKEKAERIAKEIGGYAIKADVSSALEVKAMFDEIHEKFGKVDVLINNAGICLRQGLFIDVTEEETNRVLGVNLVGTLNCTKLALIDMLEKGKGSIVNVSSIFGSRGGSCEAVYSASKGGVEAFTKSLAKELKYSKVIVNAVAPDITDTDMNSHLTAYEIKDYVKHTKSGKLLKAEEVADVVYEISQSEKTGRIVKV